MSVSTTDSDQPLAKRARWLLLPIFLVVCFIVYFLFEQHFSWDEWIEHEQAIRDYTRSHFLLSLLFALVVYFLIASTSVPGTWSVSMLFGWLLGFFPAIVVISFASTAGATVTFLLSRYLFRDFVENRFEKFWAQVEKAFEAEGGYYLLSLRLIPGIPFLAINALMGLTTMKTRDYWLISQLGMLPGTCAFVWAGASLPHLQSIAKMGMGGVLNWQLIAALTVLGLLPITVRRIVSLFKK